MPPFTCPLELETSVGFQAQPHASPPPLRFTSVPFAVKEATTVPRPAILGRGIQGNAGDVEMG